MPSLTETLMFAWPQITLHSLVKTVMHFPTARCLLLLAILVTALPGCASLTNPTANAIPVNRLPMDVLGESREVEQTIPEKFLKANKQDPYILAPNDVLGVFIRNI